LAVGAVQPRAGGLRLRAVVPVVLVLGMVVLLHMNVPRVVKGAMVATAVRPAPTLRHFLSETTCAARPTDNKAFAYHHKKHQLPNNYDECLTSRLTLWYAIAS
jgi:hypothetical protein